MTSTGPEVYEQTLGGPTDMGEEEMPETSDILRNKIPWHNLAGNIITPHEEELIQRYDKQNEKVQAAILADEGSTYAALFLKLVSNILTPLSRQYVLALIDDLLQVDESRSSLFLSSQVAGSSPYQPFLHLLHDSAGDDAYTSCCAARILAYLVIGSAHVPDGLVESIFVWTSKKLHNRRSLGETVATLRVLKTLLRKNPLRVMFVNKDGINQLVGLIKLGVHHQQLYEAIYCMWLLSYNRSVAAHHFSRTRAIPQLAAVLRGVSREKVVRICVLTLNNLSGRGKNNLLMIEEGVLKQVTALSHTKFPDPDVTEKLEKLKENLYEDLQKLSSWERYHAELNSGNLEWSVTHKSERFWRENVLRFEDNEFEALGKLIEVVRSSVDPVVISTGLHDMGEFSRYHPRGRTIMKQLPSARSVVMQLLEHENSDVQRQALLCMQKMLVSHWEFLPTGAAGGGAGALPGAAPQKN